MTENPKSDREKHAKSQHTRPTVGYLTLDLSPYQTLMWSGAVDVAQARDVNLLTFVGSQWGNPPDFGSQANLLYELVGPADVDGLVLNTASLVPFSDFTQLNALLARCRPLPATSIALRVEDAPSTVVKGELGMYDLVSHLIETHGYRRIALIRGNEGHSEDDMRYRGYVDALATHHLPLNPNLVTPHYNWPTDWQKGSLAAVEMLLDERKLRPKVDIDAIIGSNDASAVSVIEILRERGIRVPLDVAVVGFDDQLICQSVTPSLSTVRQPIPEQARWATETLLEMMAGQPVPAQVIMPTQMVIRQSCGCLDPVVVQAVTDPAQPNGIPFDALPAAQREAIITEMTQAAGMSEVGPTSDWARHLLDGFVTAIKARSSELFLQELDELLRQVGTMGGNVEAWQSGLSVLRRRLLPYLEGEVLARADDLWQQMRVMIGQAAKRIQAYHTLQAEHQAETLRQLSRSLFTTFDLASLINVLAESLPRLDIPSCYLSLYEDPKQPLAWSRLVLAYTEHGRIALEPGGRRFPSSHLVPEGLWPQGRRYTYVVEALYFREEQVGFVLFEVGPREGSIYDALRGQISSALKGALIAIENANLYQEALRARETAERADQLKTRLLANVSHELRAPLNVILGYTKVALTEPNPYGVELLPDLRADLGRIYSSGEHLIRLINDLLDLSRAEIGELDLFPETIAIHSFLEQVFHSTSDGCADSENVTWELRLPERLPMIQADPVRLRQVLFNLLNNARRFTPAGHIILGAEVSLPHLHIWVQDTGLGIPFEQQELIFQPFVTFERSDRRPEGIGLGLSIVRRLVALHGGAITLDSVPGQGSTFHIYLPLPTLTGQLPTPFASSAPSELLLLSSGDLPPQTIVELSRRSGWTIRRLRVNDDLDVVLQNAQPAMLAWDLTEATADEWALVQRLRSQPHLCRLPFVVYDREQPDRRVPPVGMTDVITKPVSGKTLLDTLSALGPPRSAEAILIVDDDPQARELYKKLASQALPGHPLHLAESGQAALDWLARETPGLIILDLMMPEVDGFVVLEHLRADRRTRQVPVLVISGKILSLEDIQRLDYVRVTFQSKEILSEDEAVDCLRRVFTGSQELPQPTSSLVKRALSCIHQNYARSLSRREIAAAVGVSESYLSKILRQEVGLSLWECLTRLRVQIAKELLSATTDSITEVAGQVGFEDPAYFSRVFSKYSGQSPQAYRKQAKTNQTFEVSG